MSHEAIPFLDLARSNVALEKELTAVFVSALRSGHFVGGPMVEEFELQFARFCGAAHAVAVGNGTDALRFALMAAGVRAHDVVITVPNTFIATTEAISQAGATPMFVDIDEKTYTMDSEALKSFLDKLCYFDTQTGRTYLKQGNNPITAIVPVHLYGQMADMDPILTLAANYHLQVIEDACQAHGAQYRSSIKGMWLRAGVMGTAGAFSFYPGKNLGGLGEGGAVTTNDPAIARTIQMLRDHGQNEKYYHDFEGYNGRLDAIQAGMLSEKLKHLDKWNSLRAQHAAAYTAMLQGVEGITAPFEPEYVRSVHHLYVIRARERDRLRDHLTKQGIGTGLHYPVPLHLQKAYSARHFRAGAFPVTERAAREILSLPMFPELTGRDQEIIVSAIAEFVGAGVAA